MQSLKFQGSNAGHATVATYWKESNLHDSHLSDGPCNLLAANVSLGSSLQSLRMEHRLKVVVPTAGMFPDVQMAQPDHVAAIVYLRFQDQAQTTPGLHCDPQQANSSLGQLHKALPGRSWA